jgi:hypothetical protein
MEKMISWLFSTRVRNLCAVAWKSVSDLFNLSASGGVGEESDRRGLRRREEKGVVSHKGAKGAKIKEI